MIKIENFLRKVFRILFFIPVVTSMLILLAIVRFGRWALKDEKEV